MGYLSLLEAGVAGCLLKDIKCQELAQVIRRVYQGELVIDERLASTSQVVEGILLLLSPYQSLPCWRIS